MAPLSMEFPKQEYWSRLLFLIPRDLSDPVTETGFVAPLSLVAVSLPLGHLGTPICTLWWCSVAQSCPTLWDPMDCSMSGLPIPHHLPEFTKFMSIASVMPSSHLFLWCSPLLMSSIFPSIGDFPNELAVHTKWPKYWSFSISISPSNEHSGLIFFKTDWFDLLTVQGTFRSLLQQHSLKASILWQSAFFMVQLLQPYMITEKTIALTIQTFVGRVMSLAFNTLSRFVMAFLPRSNHLLIWWLRPTSTVIVEPKKRKSVTANERVNS